MTITVFISVSTAGCGCRRRRRWKGFVVARLFIMTDGGDLPWEITEIIFQYMSLDALRNAALASKVFHEEARKYMFQGVTLTVNFHNALVLHYLKSKERPDLDEIQERLVFFTSDPIHQFVRSCRILYVAPDPGSEALVDALCAQLSHFPKLQSLYLDSTNITSERAEGISRCTSLLSIFLVNCSSPPITRTLRHTVSAPSLYIQKDVGRPQKWLSLMNLDTLSHLQLETPSAALDALEEMTAFEATSITSIAIDGDESVVRADTLSTAISKCPHLTKLKVLTPSRNVSLHPLPEDVVLSKFDGPQDMLKSVLANQKNLRRVRLNGSRWSNTCDTFDIRLQLPLLQTHAPNLESLQLRAFPTAYLCNLIASSFPNLQALSFELPLQTQKEEPMQALTREPFFPALLHMMLPANLQHLVILSMIASNSIEGKEVIETLTHKYTSLKHVYLHFPNDYWMNWTELPHSTEGKTGVHRGYVVSGYLDVLYDWF